RYRRVAAANERAGLLTKVDVGYRDEGCVHDEPGATQQRFDLLSCDLLAPTIALVFGSALHNQVTARQLTYHVVGAVEAFAGEGRRVVFWRTVIASDSVRSAG